MTDDVFQIHTVTFILFHIHSFAFKAILIGFAASLSASESNAYLDILVTVPKQVADNASALLYFI